MNMVIHNKSHGRKTDKETQSPTLKIFKDMINDPEKANLLKEMQGERLRKNHHGSRSKSDHKVRDSSSSERQGKHAHPVPFKTSTEQRNVDQTQCRDSSIPFQNEKKDSWWFWGDTVENPKPEEDGTCSCASCALKRLFSSENACICGYIFLFLASICLALYLLFKNIPSLSTLDQQPAVSDSERLKRKIELLRDGMTRKYGDDSMKLKLDDRKDWDDTLSKSFDGLSGISDFGASSLRELDSLEERSKLSSDLSSIIFSDKLNDADNSERLRDFYKKLIQTDAQIRNLKKGLTDFSIHTNTDYDFQLPERAKRSLIAKHHKKHPVMKKRKGIIDHEVIQNPKLTILYPPLHLLHKNKATIRRETRKPQARFKRHDNNTKDPTGIVIQKKKLIVQYDPNFESKKVPKCSHTPKESKSHENQLKHPFYKNSQRLDELLDQFVDRNILKDPLEMEDLFQRKNPCKHPKVNNDDAKDAKGVKSIIDIDKSRNTVTSPDLDYMKKVLETDTGEEGPNTYGVALSISTLLNPGRPFVTYPSFIEKDPRARKLMQLKDEDDENLGYEDLNEVLADNLNAHDENDKEFDRFKRMPDSFPNQIPNPTKYVPPGVFNPNWKGPMPLYPDELSSMIKQAALNFNKIPVPLNQDGTPEIAEGENERSDTEYVEDYLNSKNDRLVKMAQAYSDYGVLEGKKETMSEVTTQTDKTMEKRVKLSVNKGFDINLGRWRKKTPTMAFPQPTEGIRFELRPTSGTREDNPNDVFNMLRKHVKITHNHGDDKPKIYSPTYTPDVELSYTPTNTQINDELKKYITSTTADDNNFIFEYNKGRKLQSVDLKAAESEINEEIVNDSNDEGIKRETSQINVDDDDDNDVPIENSDRFVKRFDNHSKILEDTDNNNTSAVNDISMIFSDFFGLLASWFSALDGVDISANKSISNINSTNSEMIQGKTSIANKSAEIIYPIYDSDMIDNIGHRSRVLMAFEDISNATLEHKNEMVDVSSNEKKSTAIAGKNRDLNNNTNYPLNITTTETINTVAKDTKAATNNIDKTEDKRSIKNKTLVKRNVEDSNLIFWNDIYDDEYGIQPDPIENTLRDKNSVKSYNTLVQNSKLWLQRKMKRLQDNMRKGTENGLHKTTKKRPGRSINGFGTEKRQNSFHKQDNKVFKRDSSLNLDDEDLDTNKGTNFAELTENMKKVCQKAARAVQQTRNIGVREDTKEESVATSLMQQLVRLMTDLVDYQVEQKTCVKLPPDLSSFLAWLTSPNQNQVDPDAFKMSHHVNDAVDVLSAVGTDGLPEPMAPSSEKEDIHPDSRSECLGTLRAVQDLMHQYEVMTDEDKSKMTGVKQYLESQLEYLNKQLSTIDETHVYQEKDAIKYKRQTYTDRKNKGIHRTKRLHRFMKNYSKKFTRTTPILYETIQENDKRKQNGRPRKRNLKDVYYKAVLDSQKYTTVKNLQRKE